MLIEFWNNGGISLGPVHRQCLNWDEGQEALFLRWIYRVGVAFLQNKKNCENRSGQDMTRRKTVTHVWKTYSPNHQGQFVV